MNNRNGWWLLCMSMTVGMGLAQLLAYLVHERGFALGYGNEYTFQGDLLRAAKAPEWVFKPRAEPGQIVVRVLPRTHDGLETEGLRVCRRGGYTCRFGTEVKVLTEGRYRLEFSRTRQGQTQAWVAYAAEINRVGLLVYLEGTARVGLLEHFWSNSRLEAR